MRGRQRPPAAERLKSRQRWSESRAAPVARSSDDQATGGPRAEPGAVRLTAGRSSTATRRCRRARRRRGDRGRAARDGARGGPRARLRRPVLAADRAPDPRVRGLRRAAAPRPRAGAIRERAPAALVLSGGPASVYSDGAPKLRRELLELGIPVLGICYGMQAMVLELGGKVEGAEAGEFGRTTLTVAGDGGRLLAGLPAEQQCWMSHRDSVFEPPAGLRGARREPRLAGRGARGHRARPVRDPVPPRGRPHALRPADPGPLPARDRRLRGRLVAGVGDRPSRSS